MASWRSKIVDPKEEFDLLGKWEQGPSQPETEEGGNNLLRVATIGAVAVAAYLWVLVARRVNDNAQKGG